MSNSEFKKLFRQKFKTKVEAAKYLGVSRQTIINWIDGKHRVPKSINKLLNIKK